MKETKSFIIRTVVSIVIFAVLITIASTLIQSPVISNEIALGQMENSDLNFAGMDTYNNVRQYISIVLYVISASYFVRVVYNIYKFTKTKIEKKKENIT